MAETYTVLVTGANSGLGFAICCRLIDDFFATHPAPQKLRIIVTTRDQTKGDDTLRRLQKHLNTSLRWADDSYPGVSAKLRPRVSFGQERLELTSLRSVRALADRLVQQDTRIDALVCNAGIGGWVAIDWLLAVRTVLTEWVQAVTWPRFKKAGTGWVTKPQLSSTNASQAEPPLGEVFCANLFGHYVLAHGLLPVMTTPAGHPAARIIWVSSVEAHPSHFDPSDLQGLRSTAPYESSKQLTDLLALTASLPGSQPWVRQYLGQGKEQTKEAESQPPKIYLCHPGVCQTTIYPLPFIVNLAFLVAIYIARFMGSIWHTITPYKGACAPTWLALEEQDRLDRAEEKAGVGKWGSSVNIFGRERVERTEVEGLGFGTVAETVLESSAAVLARRRRHRKNGMLHLTPELRERFDENGRQCWREMEELRLQWEELLKLDS